MLSGVCRNIPQHGRVIEVLWYFNLFSQIFCFRVLVLTLIRIFFPLSLPDGVKAQNILIYLLWKLLTVPTTADLVIWQVFFFLFVFSVTKNLSERVKKSVIIPSQSNNRAVVRQRSFDQPHLSKLETISLQLHGLCVSVCARICLYLFMSRCAFVYLSAGWCVCVCNLSEWESWWSSDFRFGFDDSQSSLLWFGAWLPEAPVCFPALFCHHTVNPTKDDV